MKHINMSIKRINNIIIASLIILIIVSCRQSTDDKRHIITHNEHEWKFIFSESEKRLLHLDKCDTLRTKFHYLNYTDSAFFFNFKQQKSPHSAKE